MVNRDLVDKIVAIDYAREQRLIIEYANALTKIKQFSAIDRAKMIATMKDVFFLSKNSSSLAEIMGIPEFAELLNNKSPN